MADLTKSGTWSITPPPGITCSIDPGTGILTITGMSVSEAEIPVLFTYGAIVRPATVRVQRSDDPVSVTTNAGGGGGSGGTTNPGTTATTSTLPQTTGTSYDTVNSASPTLQAVAGTNGIVDLSAPISYRRISVSNGKTGAAGKWQWRVVGGTYADVATEIIDSVNYAQTEVNPGDPTVQYPGALNVNTSKSGLVSGTTYEFRFLWREVALTGTAADLYIFNSTLSAIGS